MTEPTALSLSQLFSQLTDCHVSFTYAQNASPGKAPVLFAVYEQAEERVPIIVRAEVAMVATLAGALLGMPEDTAIQRALLRPVDEPVRDAMYEVLNIGSTPLCTEGRVVFQEMVFDPREIAGGAAGLLQNAAHKSTYRVTINSTERGVYTLLS